MKNLSKIIIIILSLVLSGVLNAATTKFNYQGKVIFNGAPANGTYDVNFGLYDNEVGGSFISLSINTLNISNGLINMELDFGDNPFDGQDLWIEISIAIPSTVGTILEPRIKINTSPYAIQADFVADNSINSVSIENNSITENDIATGVIPWNKNGNDINYTNGNVGIGITNPTGLLHIQGDSTKELQLFGGSSSPVIHFRRTNNASDWVLKQDATGGKFHIQKELADGHEIMTVTSSGQVGIGTTSPTGVLDVRDSAGDVVLNVFSSGSITRKVVTRSVTLGYHSFQSIDSTLNYREVFNLDTLDGIQNNPQTSNRVYISPLVLPSGAKIISMSLLAYDNDLGAAINIQLVQTIFNTSSNSIGIAAIDTGLIPGAVIVTNDTINHFVIEEHPYSIRVSIPPQAIIGTDLLFSAVRIRYEINSL